MVRIRADSSLCPEFPPSWHGLRTGAKYGSRLSFSPEVSLKSGKRRPTGKILIPSSLHLTSFNSRAVANGRQTGAISFLPDRLGNCRTFGRSRKRTHSGSAGSQNRLSSRQLRMRCGTQLSAATDEQSLPSHSGQPRQLCDSTSLRERHRPSFPTVKHAHLFSQRTPNGSRTCWEVREPSGSAMRTEASLCSLQMNL